MNDLSGTIKGIFLLKDESFQQLLVAENSMKLGIYLLLACFLIVGLPTVISDTIDKVQPFTVEQAEAIQEEFLQGFERITPFLPTESDEFRESMELFMENFAMGAHIGAEIEALPRPLPRAVGGFFQALGSWISSPLAHLATWMSYAVWVLLFAKISGGRGGVNRFLGLTALYAVPNLLGFLSFIPILGFVFRWVGVVWGWVIYVKAVQVSQEFSPGKAILVAVLPIVVVFVVLLFFTFIFGIAFAALIGSAISGTG